MVRRASSKSTYRVTRNLSFAAGTVRRARHRQRQWDGTYQYHNPRIITQFFLPVQHGERTPPPIWRMPLASNLVWSPGSSSWSGPARTGCDIRKFAAPLQTILQCFYGVAIGRFADGDCAELCPGLTWVSGAAAALGVVPEGALAALGPVFLSIRMIRPSL